MRLSENQMRVLIILTWELRVASESQLASRLGLTLTRLRQLAHRLKKHGLLTSWRTTLQRAKDSAQERLKQLHEECREIKSSMKSLDAALRALDSSKASKTLKQKPPPTGAFPFSGRRCQQSKRRKLLKRLI